MTDAGIHFEACNNLKIGGFAMFKGRPCRIVEMNRSKPGKNGTAKIHMVGIDVFTGRKHEDISPSTRNAEVPEMKKIDAALLDIADDGYVSVVIEGGFVRADLRLPAGEVGDKIREKFGGGRNISVCIQSCAGEEQIVSFKESKD